MASNEHILVDLMAQVIDDMRYTGVVSSSNEISSGIYELNSSNELINNEVVLIDGTEYIVSNVTSDSFNIEGITGLDFSGLSWKALAPYYEYGHILEIANTLSEKDQANGIYTYQKYPLIILKQDYQWNKSTSNDAIHAEVKANIIICNYSQPHFKSKDRYDYNFRTVEYPLYDRLMESIYYSGLFRVESFDTPISHDGFERPYWGSDANPNNSHNILNDYIDAIELQNVDLKIIRGNEFC